MSQATIAKVASGLWGKVSKMAVMLLLCSLAAISATAQGTTASMLGSVTDKLDKSVPGAQVIARNTQTNLTRETSTNEQGEYRMDFLPTGTYQLQVTAPGFKKATHEDIVLQLNAEARVDVKLEIGNVTQTVTVTSEVPLVNTSNAEIGRTVENTEIVNLPLVNRNVYSLLDITPGVERNDNSIVLGYPEQRTLINGGTDGGAGSVNYYLDGGPNMAGLRNTGNATPNPDAVQEFRVQTNSYNAEYGRFAGGVISVLTKSGTNQFHGSIFEFWRNNALNAHDWNNPADSPLHRNQFGATIGGPIRRDKTFFFGSYGGLRQIQSTFMNSAIVPTAAERNGDFSKSVGVSFDVPAGTAAAYPNQTPGKPFHCDLTTGSPTGGTQTNNVICPNYFDAAAANILNKVIPLPNKSNTVGGVQILNGWQGVVPNPFNTDEYLAKVDHNWGNHRLSAAYYTTSGDNIVRAGTGNLDWAIQKFQWRQHNANVNDTWVISPNKINQVWLSFTRYFGGRLNLSNPALGIAPDASLANFGSAITVQGAPSLANISLTGYFSLTNAIGGPTAGSNFYTLRDTFSYTRGKHAFKFGGEGTLQKDVQDTLLNNYGTFSFNGSATANSSPTPKIPGNALADFLLGIPNNITQDAPIRALTNSWLPAVFVQDDYRVLSRLTLNLGLRWDIQTPPTDPQNREGTYEPGVKSTVNPNAPVGQLFPGDPGVTRGVVPVRWHHVSPRIGLAWDLFGDGKTSVRAGFGVFYGTLSGNNWNQPSNFEPFATRLIFTNTGSGKFATGGSLSNPYRGLSGGDPFPYQGAYTPGGGILGIATNFQWPYTYQTNLSVQRQVTNDLSLSVAYVGSLAHDLPFAQDVNYPRITANASTGNVQQRRPNPSFGSVLLVQSNQGASYHAIQVTATKRMAHHLLLNAFYTFGKNLNSVELDNNQTQGGAQNMSILSEDRSRADIDQRQVFSVSGVWQPVYSYGGNAVIQGVLNGWSISPIVRWHSGLPFTVSNGVDANLDGTNNDRANLAGDPHSGTCPGPGGAPVGTVLCWFNTAAFTRNPAVTGSPVDGNAGRNLLDQPGFKTVDLAIFREFKFRERFGMEVRAEATNTLNMVNLNAPNSTVGSSTFGQISGAGTMRQLQLGLRLRF
jgi:carboxypeptidase family protein